MARSAILPALGKPLGGHIHVQDTLQQLGQQVQRGELRTAIERRNDFANKHFEDDLKADFHVDLTTPAQLQAAF